MHSIRILTRTRRRCDIKTNVWNHVRGMKSLRSVDSTIDLFRKIPLNPRNPGKHFPWENSYFQLQQ